MCGIDPSSLRREDAKMSRCLALSVFYDVKKAQKEDFAQAAYEIQLIERMASRAASLRKHVGEKSELNFVIERLWIDSVQREYESQANEEDVNAACSMLSMEFVLYQKTKNGM